MLSNTNLDNKKQHWITKKMLSKTFLDNKKMCFFNFLIKNICFYCIFNFRIKNASFFVIQTVFG